MDKRLQKVIEEFSDILASGKGRYVKAVRLTKLYSRLGAGTDALDNMLYREIGMSCEEIVDMLRKGDMKIC